MRFLVLLLFITTAAAADPTPDQLAKDRLDAAAKVYPSLVARYKSGTATFDEVAAWSLRWLDAALDAPKAKAKPALADYVTRTQDVESLASDRVKAGIAPATEADEATYVRIEAQLWAARGKK